MSPKRVIKPGAQRLVEEPLALAAGDLEMDWGPAREEMRQLAAGLVAEARTEADRLLAAAREEAGKEREKARAEGAAAGRAEAYREAEAEAAALLSRLRSAVEEAGAAVAEARAWLTARQDALVLALAAALAEAAWGQALAADPGRLAEYVARAAASLETEAVEVYLAPGTLARLRALNAALVAAGPALSWQSRPELGPGDVLLRFAGGGRDASPVTVLANLVRQALETGRGLEEAGGDDHTG